MRLLGSILGLWLLLTAAAFAETTKVGTAQGWVIFYDSDDAGSCFAGATYTGGDSFFISLTAPGREWSFGFYNPAWQSIVPGQSYQLKYVFNGRRSWTGPSTGEENALRSGNLKESFVLDIANSRSMALYYAGQKLGNYSLRGTRAAVQAVIQCYKRYVNKVDPFAKQDPFSKADPFTGQKAADPFAGSQSK